MEYLLIGLLLLLMIVGFVWYLNRDKLVGMRGRKSAVRIYLIVSDDEKNNKKPVLPINLSALPEERPKWSHSLYSGEKKIAGITVDVLTPMSHSRERTEMYTEVVLSNKKYVFSEIPGTEHGSLSISVAAEAATLSEKAYALTRGFFNLSPTTLNYGGIEYTFKTNDLLKSFTWKDQTGKEILSARMKYNIYKNKEDRRWIYGSEVEIYSKGFLPEEGELVLSVGGLHCLTFETVSKPLQTPH